MATYRFFCKPNKRRSHGTGAICRFRRFPLFLACLAFCAYAQFPSSSSNTLSHGISDLVGENMARAGGGPKVGFTRIGTFTITNPAQEPFILRVTFDNAAALRMVDEQRPWVRGRRGDPEVGLANLELRYRNRSEVQIRRQISDHRVNPRRAGARPARSGRPDRPEGAVRPDRPDGSVRPDRPEGSVRLDRPDRPDRSDGTVHSLRSGHSGRPDGTGVGRGRSERAERPRVHVYEVEFLQEEMQPVYRMELWALLNEDGRSPPGTYQEVINFEVEPKYPAMEAVVQEANGADGAEKRRQKRRARR